VLSVGVIFEKSKYFVSLLLIPSTVLAYGEKKGKLYPHPLMRKVELKN
jgi:hypothetical protein